VAQGRIDHVASEHTLDTTHATVPPVGPTNQLHPSTRPSRASQSGQGHTYSGRQTGVRRKIAFSDPLESGSLSELTRAEHTSATIAPAAIAPAITSAPLQACVAALDSAMDAVLILDRSGLVQYLNRACVSLLARERCEQRIVGRHVLGLVCLDGAAIRNILRALGHANVWNGTLQVELGARCRAVELCVRRVAGPGASHHHHHARTSRTQSFSVIARPAAGLARGSHALEHVQPSLGAADATPQSADMLSTLARVGSEMAHDFNNQLAVVLNYSFILLRELPTRSPMRTHVTELQGAAWRAAEVAREVLRFGARRDLDATEIDVQQLVRATQPSLASMLAGGQTKVELRLAAESCSVFARRAQLEWLLFELSARLQSRLGRLASLRISTSMTFSGDNAVHDKPRALIALDAHAAPDALTTPATRSPLLSEAQAYAGAPQGLRAAERTLEQAHGELTLHALPDGGLRYLICLPATRI
jgi:PAS domain-containing protein